MERVISALAAALALLLALVPRPAGAARPQGGTAAVRRPVAVEDLARIREVEDPRVSPDGSWVAYTVTTQNLAEDLRQSDLWMTSWDGATTLRLTSTPKESETAPRWSPDGRHLAFLSGRGDPDEVEQLWLLPLAGGEAERLTELKSGVEDFAWSPDGSRFVLVVADTDTVSRVVAEGRDPAPPPLVIDRYYFKEDGVGLLDHRRSHLYLFELATRRLTQLTRGDNDDLAPAWSPDGRSLAFLSKRGPDADRTNSWEVYRVEARPGAEPLQLTRFEGFEDNPGGEGGENRIAWSPDGRFIAFLRGGPPKLLYYAVNRLAVVPADGGPVRVLTPDLDRWVSDLAWAPDGRSLLVILEEDRAQHLARVPVTGGAPGLLPAGGDVVSGFDVSASGRIAALLSSAAALPEVFALDGAAPRPLSRQNDSLLAGLRLGTLEETRFRSRDGTEVHGLMLKPPDFRPGRRYPTIVRLHGGPVGQFVPAVDLDYDLCWQVLAARGYVILLPNPRGSSGRGEAFARAIYADWGDKDAQDVLAAVDDAVARGIADSTRLGIGGWSYGGMLTNYVITRDRRFKAATSGASISNVLAGYGTDQYVREYEAELGPPWAATATWLRVSNPFLHADRIVTPTLFLCGEEDANVPLLNSEQMYQALRSLGLDTRLVVYPGQHHVISRPSYVLDRMRRYLEWYDRHLR